MSAPPINPEEAQALQRVYRKRRRIWAHKIGRPYREDLCRPEPGLYDAPASEDG